MRISKCKYCNYDNKYGRITCSYCFRPTPIWNRWWFFPVVLIAAGLAYLAVT